MEGVAVTIDDFYRLWCATGFGVWICLIFTIGHLAPWWCWVLEFPLAVVMWPIALWVNRDVPVGQSIVFVCKEHAGEKQNV